MLDLSGRKAAMPDVVRRMAGAIVHRGPDEDGFLDRSAVCLGNRRLSIVGLKDGRQPIGNEDGSIQVVFNGELFNYPEQRRELEARGHRFGRHTDTELLPHMWEEHQRPYDFFRFTSGGIRYLLETAGIRIRRIHPVGGFFWQLGRRLIGVLSFTQSGWRWLLFPVLAPVFGLVLPLCCYYLDTLDEDRAYTLGFLAEGWKQ